MVKENEKEREIKICPKCGSTDITIPPRGMDLKMTLQDYCKNCRNIGNFPIIKITDIKKFRKLKNP